MQMYAKIITIRLSLIIYTTHKLQLFNNIVYFIGKYNNIKRNDSAIVY